MSNNFLKTSNKIYHLVSSWVDDKDVLFPERPPDGSTDQEAFKDRPGPVLMSLDLNRLSIIKVCLKMKLLL